MLQEQWQWQQRGQWQEQQGNGNVIKEGIDNSSKSNGNGNKEGKGKGNGNGDDVKDMAACTTTGERAMMVAMGHGLRVCFCVCGETTKNKIGPKKCQCVLEHRPREVSNS